MVVGDKINNRGQLNGPFTKSTDDAQRFHCLTASNTDFLTKNNSSIEFRNLIECPNKVTNTDILAFQCLDWDVDLKTSLDLDKCCSYLGKDYNRVTGRTYERYCNEMKDICTWSDDTCKLKGTRSKFTNIRFDDLRLEATKSNGMISINKTTDAIYFKDSKDIECLNKTFEVQTLGKNNSPENKFIFLEIKL